LLIIEQQSKNDADLQNNLAVADECGNLGTNVERKNACEMPLQAFEILLIKICFF
jgi:hypothetical protein